MSAAAVQARTVAHDPITRLTSAERAFVAELNRTKTRDEILSELKKGLQLAVEVELATIPIYLFTYYSIVRDNVSGENAGPLDVFANKAAAVIMSVAIEEMLHMSLSSNVLHAMGEAPRLYRHAPKAYPALLPGHNPVGPRGPDGQTGETIPLARFSFGQLWHFLQIEYPEPLDAPPQSADWQTIGQLYSYVRCLMRTDHVGDVDFQRGAAAKAIQPYNYSPNNVDTVYPTGKFDSWKPAPPSPMPNWSDGYPSAAGAARFTDRADSHAGHSQLIAVRSRDDALEAIDTICDQGEGYPVPDLGAGGTDDPSKDEQSHYMKFLTLQAQFDRYGRTTETLGAEPPPPPLQRPTVSEAALEAAGVIIAFPDNPTNAGYPEHLRAIANFCSACFQYMLVMTETVYRVPPEGQKLFFNEGLHRSMIWVLDKYIRTIREIPLDDRKTIFMAPTFENIDLGTRAESFAGLTRHGLKAIEHAQKLANDPKTPAGLATAYSDVAYYAALAIGQPAGIAPGKRPLPDVGPYWSER